jgi:hypothetical protein
MEFQGRISKLLPMRQGTSAKTGNEWYAQPFVFEYFENPTDRYADSVVLETFDANIIPHLKEGMEVICGFGHKAKPITKQDGTQTIVNEMRLYKIESVRGAQAAQQAPQGANASAAGNIQGHVGQELQKKATDTLQVNQQEDPNDDLTF